MNRTQHCWFRTMFSLTLFTILTAALFGQSAGAEDEFTKIQGRIHTDLIFEKVFIPPNGIPAYLVSMKAKFQDTKPAVVLLHGGEAGTADKKQLMGGLWPIELARMGYLVACTDAWGCGEHPGVEEFKNMAKTSLWDTLIPRIMETAIDSGAVYDYLAARPDIDGQRIGLMGISGGAMTAFVAAMRPNRYSAFVAINGLCDFLSPRWEDMLFYQLKGIHDVSAIADADRARIREMDPMYHVEKIAPQPLAMIHGKHDQLAVPSFTRGLHEKLVSLYAAVPAKLSWKAFDAYPLPTHRKPDLTEVLVTHAVTPGMTQYAYDWLEKYVKGAGFKPEDGWQKLFNGTDLSGWKPQGPSNARISYDWAAASNAAPEASNSKQMSITHASDGRGGLLVNGARGRSVNIVSVEEFADVELYLEFMVPKGSNSGVYLAGLYEVQVLDSFGKPDEELEFGDCGGIYARYIDKQSVGGVAPPVNVSRAPGEWQSFHIWFRAPRFDSRGAKTENARFLRVVHNDTVLHEDVELHGPTRAHMPRGEASTGPLMLQGDHGPVAYRKIYLRSIK